jgi:uncharacterized protein
LWHIETQGSFYIRLPNDPIELRLLAVSSALIVSISVWHEKELSKNIRWIRTSLISEVVAGVIGSLVISLPILAFVGGTSPAGSPTVDVAAIDLLMFSIIGNLYEELLFRGFMQTYLTKCSDVGDDRAVFISGVTFAFCHCSLATATTDTGAPLLIFCLFEGLIAAKLYSIYGLIAAAVAHGGAIFLLSGGLF